MDLFVLLYTINLRLFFAEMAEFEVIAVAVEEAIESVGGEIEELPEETQTIIKSEIDETPTAVEEFSATEQPQKVPFDPQRLCIYSGQVYCPIYSDWRHPVG